MCPETEDMKMYFRGDEHRKVASPSPMAAEAPELSSTPQSEVSVKFLISELYGILCTNNDDLKSFCLSKSL